MDDKASMLSQLEAITIFLRKNGQPFRTLFLAYGHDEEVHGMQGAGKIADYLNQTQLEYVLDEGSMIVDDVIPQLKKPIAYISVGKKKHHLIL